MPERRIWEFEGFTLCRILGTFFDDARLRRVFRDFKLGNGKKSAHQMHEKLISLCTTQNQVSMHVENMLKKMSEPYEGRIGDLGKDKIVEMMKEGNTGIPISTLIWFAVRRRRDGAKEIEQEVFATVHMREHQALRFYDALSRAMPPGVSAEDAIDEIKSARASNEKEKLKFALASNEKLERNLNRSKRKLEQLRSGIDEIRADKSRLSAALEEQVQSNGLLEKKLESLGGEAALGELEDMKREVELLREELKILSEQPWGNEMEPMPGIANETVRLTQMANPEFCLKEPKDALVVTSYNPGELLKDVKVAYVGGVDSLISCYRETVESFGGIFYHHCGRCEKGKREMESLVGKSDVILCPVDINSHNACRLVKKTCKSCNKPCYFLRSSSLTTLKNRLADLANPTILD